MIVHVQDAVDLTGEVSDAVRDQLWAESGERPAEFLAALTEAGYGRTRLAGRVNLLVEILARGRDLGWNSQAAIERETHLSAETFRKLRVEVRDMQDRTAIAIADNLGWTRESVERVLAFGKPTVIRGWKPYGQRRSRPAQTDERRKVFAGLGLDRRDLDDILRRYDLGDPRTQQLAAAIARTLTEDIDETWRDYLIRGIRNSIAQQLAAERDSIAEVETQLDTLRRGRDEETGRTALR